MQDRDTTIWLLGTIHVLPRALRWETPEIARAIDAADTLVTEIPAGAAQNAPPPAHLLPPIAERLPVDRAAALQRAAAAAGFDIVTLDRMGRGASGGPRFGHHAIARAWVWRHPRAIVAPERTFR